MKSKKTARKKAARNKIMRKRKSIFRSKIRRAKKPIMKMRPPVKVGETIPAKDKPHQKKKLSKELSELIALGKEKGHLTFEEVNNILPIEIVSSEEIDEILSVL